MFISCNSEKKSQNCEFIFCNSEKNSQNCVYISQICEKSQNCEIKSRYNLFFFFFFSVAETGFHSSQICQSIKARSEVTDRKYVSQLKIPKTNQTDINWKQDVPADIMTQII